MSAFGRGEGRWLSDVTPLAAALASEEGFCNLTMHTAPWAGNQGAVPWIVSLNLRLKERRGGKEEEEAPKPGARLFTPWRGTTTESGGISAVFQWNFFNASYSSLFPDYSFQLPQGTKRLTLAAYITGHGSDQHGCGEFCPTAHHFALNGATFVKDNSLPETDPKLGCTRNVSTLGVVPNEYGTWLYGRDGWCNGSPVQLWRADVSAAAKWQGKTNTLRYTGLWNGTAPDPGPKAAWEQAEPVIMISVFLVAEQ